MTSLQVMSLEYIIGVYPLLLLVLVSALVKLHDRLPTVVSLRLWGPAHRLLWRLRKAWSLRGGSLIQAFATFLVLSYVKILHVSCSILTPLVLRSAEGRTLPRHWEGDGAVPFFGREHAPYAVLALFMLATFNILPVLLLLSYPCRCFRRRLDSLLARTPGLNIHAVQTFVDIFQGYYRHGAPTTSTPMLTPDGSGGNQDDRDCRCFAALYLAARLVQTSVFALHQSKIVSALTGLLLLLLLAAAIVLARPYVSERHNRVDVTLFLTHAGIYLLGAIRIYATVYDPRMNFRLLNVLCCLPFLILVLYGLAVVGYHLCPQSLLLKMEAGFSALVRQAKKRVCSEVVRAESSLHQQLQQEDEYRPLLQTYR